MQTIPEYIPTKGDLCYVIGKVSRWGNSANRSYGAIVRIDKVRINYRRNRKDQVSSATIEVTGIEGYRGGVDESNYKADFSAELMPVTWATPEQIKEYADARAKRAEEDAKIAKERQDAQEFEAAFRKNNAGIVNAPTVYGEVVELKHSQDRFSFSSARTYHRFVGKGYDIAIEEGEHEMCVSLRWEQDRFTLDADKGKWVADFSGYFGVTPESLDAHIRCAQAAQAKLAELTETALVAA